MMLIYKVVEIKQRSFTKGLMTTMDLQNAINTWANVGWTLDRITSGETQGFLHGKDVFLLIFKKDIQIPPALFVMINKQSVTVTERNIAELKLNRLISPDTPACFKGMPEWVPLYSIAPDIVDFLIN